MVLNWDEIGSFNPYPISILHKSIAGRSRPVRVADGPITARCRFMKNASWVTSRNLSKQCRPRSDAALWKNYRISTFELSLVD